MKMPALQVHHKVDSIWGIFVSEILSFIQEGKPEVVGQNAYQTNAVEILDSLPGVSMGTVVVSGPGAWTQVFRGEGIIGEYGISPRSREVNQFDYTVAGPKKKVQAIVDVLNEKFPIFEFKQVDDSVYVNFWTAPRMGEANRFVRRVVVPSWVEICANYGAEERKELDKMMAMTTGTTAGKIALWVGPPGTGKTYAIRALAKAWRKWCKVEYAIDPDALFADGNYLTSVLLASASGQSDSTPDVEVVGEGPKAEKWRLLVLEDAGELIAKDAKSRTGQGLARLLNMADGLIGQGINLMILITTNEEFAHLNTAVSRPGRTFSKIEFKPLGGEDLKAWGKKNKVAVDPAKPRFLSDLYAGVESEVKGKVGF